jgi:hypothetical protein
VTAAVVHPRIGSRLATLGAVLTLVVVPGIVYVAATGARRPSAAETARHGQALPVRDRYWDEDIASLARELPLAHVHGLTGVRLPAWSAASRRGGGGSLTTTDEILRPVRSELL